MLPPFVIELVISSDNIEWLYDGYIKDLGTKDNKKYVLRTLEKATDKEKYQNNINIIDAMADTFEFID